MEPVLTMVIGLDGSGREDVQAEGTRVRTAEEAVRLVKGGDSAVLDAPNLRARTRRGILEQLRGVPAVKRAVVTLRPVEQCRACCPEREKEVWEQYLSFQPPETYEGWDEIELRYDESCEKVELMELFFGKDGLVFLPQDNPFHKHSIGMHCLLAARWAAKERPDDAVLQLAALLHDIGKRQTKAFFDSHGNPSPTAHYYGHEFASAYESLFVKFPAAVPESERLRVAALIVWHMTPHFFTQEKTRARYERLLGKKMLDDLAAMGYGELPVCIAKTQYSFSDNAKLTGAPTGFKMNVREVRLSAGAGFVVVICGSIMTMPGLPKHPAAMDIDVDAEGRITGLF